MTRRSARGGTTVLPGKADGRCVRSRRRIALLVVILVAAVYLGGGQRGFAAATIRVENAWARPAAAMGDTGMTGMGGTTAVYMTLVNDGQQADRLLGAATDVAVKAEIHETTMVSGVMKMRPIPALVLPAGARVVLKPGGLHVMLIDLKRDLKVGDRFKLTLRLERAGAVTTDVSVRQP